MPSDVRTAIEAQNTQITAGELGALPTRDGQALNATVTALSRLQTVSQFENIILRTQTNGAVVLLKDVARVERGAESYQTSTFEWKASFGYVYSTCFWCQCIRNG